MFKHFMEFQNEDKDGQVIDSKICKTFDWVHIRIAQLGLGITLAISKGGLHKFENEFLYKFLIACRE
jgi:hypothetical protein